MAADDHAQLTTIVARLGKALSLLNPIQLVPVTRSVVREIGTPPPGDPAALRELAEAFRVAATATKAIDLTKAAQAAPTAPAVSTALSTPAAAHERDRSLVSDAQNQTGVALMRDVDTAAPWVGCVVVTDTGQVVRAVRDAVRATPAVLTSAATALDGLAGRIEGQRERHAELHRKLRAAVHDATHVGSLPMPDPTALDDLARAAAGLIRGCIEVYTDAIGAADEAAGVFADVAGAARTSAGLAGGLDPADALVLAAQDVAVAGVGNDYDDGVLTLAQLGRAGRNLRALTESAGADAAATGSADADPANAVRGLLAGAGSTTERAYLLKAIAAGRKADELAVFADAIRDCDDAWLHHHLSLIDRGGAAGQDRFGAEVDQYDDYTCGTTSVIVARAETDPVYALELTRDLEPPYDRADRDEFDRRLSAEQARVHGETNKVWPRQLGTLPGGIEDAMNRFSDATGVRYRWHLVDDTDERKAGAALREVVTAVNAGHPVPILVGGAVPRHYVLVVGHAGGEILIFEPSSGDTRRIPVTNFVEGKLSDHAGFDHVQAVVIPQ